jgi:CBS domain containing-hemolysin-like protein
MEDYSSLLLILGIILLNGTFVAAEFAIARLRKSQVDHIVNSRNPKNLPKLAAAKILQKILGNINDYISACQVGITVASLVLGALAESKLEEILLPYISQIQDLGIDPHAISLACAIALVTFIHVIIGELIPKNLALINPEKTGLRLAFFLEFIHTIFKLPVMLLNFCSNSILKLIGIDMDSTDAIHSEDELKLILSTSQEEGIIEEEEEKLIQNVFQFNDTIARDIMHPRTDMICIEAGISIEEAMKITNKHPFSKFPVFQKRLDKIIGYVSIKEMLRAYERGGVHDPIESIVKEVLKVPDGMYIIDLMSMMQQKKKQIAILIDEYGGTSGLVTIEDIVEEVFGEISNEFEDHSQVPLQELTKGVYKVDGKLTLREINEELGSEFESEHYDTIGGFIYGLLGADPVIGAQLEANGFILEVLECLDNRVLKVKISQKKTDTVPVE